MQVGRQRTIVGQESNEEAKAATALGNAAVEVGGGQQPEQNGHGDEHQRNDDSPVEGGQPNEEGLGRKGGIMGAAVTEKELLVSA